MSILKKLPWLSLILLLLSFIYLGAILSGLFYIMAAPMFVWLPAAIAILFLVASLTIPWLHIADFSYQLFRSNLKSFSLTVLGALLLFFIVARFRLFLDIVVVFACLMLARLDLQTAGFRELQTFGIMSISSLTALGLGVFFQKLMFQYFDWN